MPGGPRQRSSHVVGRADEELPATARLFLAHLAEAGEAASPEGFRLAGDGAPANFP